MATTEQRSGFRLPWASDARPGAPANAQTPPVPDSAPDAEGVSTADPTAEATEMQETTIPDPHATSWSDPDSDSQLMSTAPELVTADPEAATSDDPKLATADLEAAAEEPVPIHPEPAPGRPRRENLLVTGLVRAMRDAATAARQETAARFADEAKTRVESIHTQAAEEATELRKQADSEIVEIRDWSKAEMARIREETDQRIADRKQHLETEIERHGARVEHRVARVQAAVDEFERQMEGFFVRLFAEDDPARLAGLAESLPEAPSLDLDDLDRDVPSFPLEILDARGAAAAEAEAFADLGSSDEDDDMVSSTDDEVSALADDDVARRLDAFTAHTSPATAAVTSQLAVVGLVSVASIAGFKRALARTHGIRSVTVASGPSGDFVFSINHDPETDLRSIVPALDGFAASITGDADGVLTATASDPDGTH